MNNEKRGLITYLVEDKEFKGDQLSLAREYAKVLADKNGTPVTIIQKTSLEIVKPDVPAGVDESFKESEEGKQPTEETSKDLAIDIFKSPNAEETQPPPKEIGEMKETDSLKSEISLPPFRLSGKNKEEISQQIKDYFESPEIIDFITKLSEEAIKKAISKIEGLQ